MNQSRNHFLYQEILHKFLSAVTDPVDDYANGVSDLVLPIIPPNIVATLCQESERIFASEPIVLSVNSPVIIVGDLHGHILDLYRILQCYGLPDKRQYLFLGDFVDRGEFSVETVIILFLLKVLFPKKVHIIRGNHEFAFLCEDGGFLSQIVAVYNDRKLFEKFIQAFSQIPLIAMVDHVMMCVHGGLGPNWNSLAQVTIMKRPIYEFNDEILNAMLWSDPTNDYDNFEPSNRGIGYLFGKSVVNEFIKGIGIKTIVRAHECVANGFEEFFDGKCLTVFSASNYCGAVGNQSAILQVSSAFRYEPVRFPSLNYLRRICAFFRREQIQACSSRHLPKRIGIPTFHSHLGQLLRPNILANKALYDSSRKEATSSQTKLTHPLIGLRYAKHSNSHVYKH